jgi:hypothetical protein
MPSVAEEAVLLRLFLVRRGLAVFSDQPAHDRWITQFLTTALRERSAETLIEVLEILSRRGMLREFRHAPRELEQALRDLELPGSQFEGKD